MTCNGPVDPPEEILARMGLIADSERIVIESLTGGVSSDIRLVHIGKRMLVLKQPLPLLRVTTRWEAPLTRSAAEARWLRFAARVIPGVVPEVIAFDPDTFAIALEYLSPDRYANWKSLLLAGDVDAEFAAAVGRSIARLHAASAVDVTAAAAFDNQSMFEDLRIEPYLRRSAAAVPEVAAQIEQIIGLLEAPGKAVIHGDLSPKNILQGPVSPVILDAECATWSDPAFDAAFCLSHLWLKAEHMPALADALIDAGSAFRAAYLREVDWEQSSAVDQRISRILPGLLLARVAGASPVEYLDDDARKRVRDHVVDVLQGAAPLHHPMTA
ncbi:MAG: aminoglycoside phosphotransferase family protein [Microbacteriaceae bacterium]|nr:MAG: aminoglycoside phosphotransferase family protein [Microbacteriaceae bacterium]